MTKLIALSVMGAAVIAYIYMEASAKINTSSFGDSVSKTTLLETNVSLDYDLDSNSIFHAHGKGFFHVTKDGVKYQMSDGQGVYDFAYSMSSAPLVVANEGVIAVGEPKGRSFFVFNASGNLYSKQMENTILTFSVNKNGVSSVISQGADGYRLDVFNEKGVSVSSGSFAEHNIFPVAMDISGDNRILAISFLNINDVYIGSNVVFTFINSAESINYADGIFSQQYFDDQLVGLIRFGENNNVAIVSESEINVGQIDPQNKYLPVWSKQLSNEISRIEFNGNKGFAVAYGETLMNKPGFGMGTVELYNYLGDTAFSFSTGGKITHLSVASNAVIVGSNRKFSAYSKNGELWTYNATQDVKQLLFLENTSQALFVTNNRAVVMKLGKERSE